MSERRKSVLVTGAASGIGRAIALRFARAGAKVAAVDRDREPGRSLVAEIEKLGGEAVFSRADVTSVKAMERAVRECVEAFGSIDVAVNNAGVLDALVTIDQHSDAAFDQTVAVNLRGVWASLRAELAAMKTAEPYAVSAGASPAAAGGRGPQPVLMRGAIVNVSSINGVRAASGSPIYSATKFGVLGLTRCAALEAAKDGVRVNAICPGPVGTSMLQRSFGGPAGIAELEKVLPLGRVARTEEIAEAVAWLASDEASYVTGQTLVVDGGLLARGGLS